MNTVMSVDSPVTVAEGGSGYTYYRDIVRIVIVRNNSRDNSRLLLL